MLSRARDFAARLAGENVLPAAAYYGSTVKVRPGLASFVLDRLALE